MHNLPSGTVTFLFTDIEGSTNLAQQYPEVLPALLARHNAILREAIETNRGQVFRMAGDAFCAAFPSPNGALQAAVSAQRALQHEAWQPAPILVRMGIHTGEARTNSVDTELDPYVGYLTLTRVQRVMSTAHGGQILLSDASAALLRRELPAEVSLRDMGAHTLKGLLQPEPLWQIVAPDLRQDFAPLQTLDIAPCNLPGTLNRMVGRTHELQEVKERLGDTRLVTLLGPGGTGKTRLALQVATELRSSFQDRVYFVDLAASRDAESVLAAIGRTVGLREKSDKPLLDDLKGYIKQTKMLSLLDNFEQVMVAAPTLVGLLQDCPELKMLVTSREALHVRGEKVFPIPPLALPSNEPRNISLAQLARTEAVQLFIERAQAVKPAFELTKENAEAVSNICVRLDGLPLAIELATARLNVFTPQALSERLANRLQLLKGGAHDLPVRQQTLRDTIDWSYELLDAAEQALFKFLSVFAGVTVDEIETVACGVDRLNESGLDILTGVGSLVDKSLLRQVEDPAGEARLQMLETIREFAAARLAEDVALRDAARRAHATYFADFTQSQWEPLIGEGREAALSQLTAELENIRTAWRYWLAEGDLEQLRKFTDSLWLLYDVRGWYHDTVQLTTDLLQVLSHTVSTPERAREEIMLQTSLARALLATKGYTSEVEQAYARAIELCERAGEIPEMFPVLRALSTFYVLRAECEKGLALGKRILNLAERLQDRDMEASAHLVIGVNVGFLDSVPNGLIELEKGLAAYDPSRQRVRRFGLGTNPGVIAQIASALYLWMLGSSDRASERAAEAITLARKLDHPFSLAYAEFHNAYLHLMLGDPDQARAHALVLLDLSEEYEFPLWSVLGSCILGSVWVNVGSVDKGLGLLEQGVSMYRGLKSPPVFLPMLFHLQAQANVAASRLPVALSILDEAIRMASSNDGKTLASEFLAFKGQLLMMLSPSNAPEAEGLLLAAVANAQDVQAPQLELRAAMPLARFWRDRGKPAQARLVLSTVYNKITEGLNRPDMQQAQALLTELGQVQERL